MFAVWNFFLIFCLSAPSPCTSSSQISSPRPQVPQLCAQLLQQEQASPRSPSSADFFIASRNTTTLTKPEPPPASLPRKLDSISLNTRIVTPPKESCLKLVRVQIVCGRRTQFCHSFPLMFPSIPENGTKSRVETQVRVTVDLVDPSSITEPYRYDRIGSWKWLKLPPGTATKRRTRKQGKIGAFIAVL